MARVYVAGAHISRGGAYMSFHAGRIIAERLGAELVAAHIGDESATTSVFEYPDEIASVPIDDVMAAASPDDVLVTAPSYSARMYGLRFPGRSVMYVQNVNTYAVIDGFCDHYVACSPFIADHLRLHYGFDVAVIAPFVHVERFPPPPPFADRPPDSVAVVVKTPGALQLDLVLERLHGEHGRTVEMTTLRGLRHDDVLATLRRSRYLLTLSAFEGLPLVPLEAMLSGCCVVGFHGRGGLTYMRPGTNSAVVGYPRTDLVADELASLLGDERRSAALAATGRADAAPWGYGPFRERWSAFTDEVVAPARRSAVAVA